MNAGNMRGHTDLHVAPEQVDAGDGQLKGGV